MIPGTGGAAVVSPLAPASLPTHHSVTVQPRESNRSNLTTLHLENPPLDWFYHPPLLSTTLGTLDLFYIHSISFLGLYTHYTILSISFLGLYTHYTILTISFLGLYTYYTILSISFLVLYTHYTILSYTPLINIYRHSAVNRQVKCKTAYTSHNLSKSKLWIYMTLHPSDMAVSLLNTFGFLDHLLGLEAAAYAGKRGEQRLGIIDRCVSISTVITSSLL